MKKLYFSIVFILMLSTNIFAQIPILTIADVTVNEGDATISVPVSLSEISSINTVIDILTATNTATNSDFTITNLTVIIPAGQTTTSVNIQIIDDFIDEYDEVFTIEGTVTSGNTANTSSSGMVTIIDNESSPNINISDATVNEDDGVVILSITLSGLSSSDTSIDVVTISGTADTSDYTSITFTFIIPPGQTTTSITIPIIDDLLDEPNETFTVHGTITSNNTANVIASGTVTIIDNDVLSLNNFSFNNLKYNPNPIKNSFEIKNSSDIETVEIFSLNGQKIYENSINAIYTKIDTSNFSKGVYVVKIKASGVEKTIKLVKE